MWEAGLVVHGYFVRAAGRLRVAVGAERGGGGRRELLQSGVHARAVGHALLCHFGILGADSSAAGSVVLRRVGGLGRRGQAELINVDLEPVFGKIVPILRKAHGVGHSCLRLTGA